MIDRHDKLYKDYKAIKQISIVPLMLDVVCRLTGLGFAAIARVTEDRWLACSVKDDVNFGLAEGNELKIETTICNEIRDSHQEVVIDHVAEDPQYKEHHTPKIYGLQSYISFPIILQDGRFFGTLCAIGTQPALLKDPKITGTFRLFSQLLSFHLQGIELIEQSHSALQETKSQLSFTSDENLLYQKISDHNLQEPLRKITLFSDLLLSHTEKGDMESTKKVAGKINSFVKELTTTIKNVSKFSNLKTEEKELAKVDLNKTVKDLELKLKPELESKNVKLTSGTLPVINAVPEQMDQAFSQLIHHALSFSKEKSSPEIKISARTIDSKDIKDILPAGKEFLFSEIRIDLSEMNIEKNTTANIFDILIHINENNGSEKYGAGLAECRKIIFNHGGMITAKSPEDFKISFTMILPTNYKIETEIPA